MTLSSIGWSDRFARQMIQFPGCIPARVSQSHRDHYLVWTEAGEQAASPAGKLREKGQLWPTTVDWVALREGGAIEAVLDRATVLERKQPGRTSREQILAANLDVLLVVMGLDHDFNPRRLERYLILAQEGTIRPVLVLNKADLHDNLAAVVREARSLASGIPVFPMSATEGWGMKDLHELIGAGETAALAGSSGTGKSTIVNRLTGQATQATQPVREHDSRGRHTTTHRELFLLDHGWLLMDLPGIRELQLLGGVKSVEEVFADIRSVAERCRFRDCQHDAEPGCMMRQEIDPARLAAWRKLRREADHAHRQVDLGAVLIDKQRWKAIHKAMRKFPRQG